MESVVQDLSAYSRRQALAHLLAYQIDMGVDCRLSDQPIDRFAPSGLGDDSTHDDTARPVASQADTRAKVPSPSLSQALRAPGPGPLVSMQSQIETAQRAASAAASIDALHQAVEAYDGCPLKETALHTVFADGNAQSARVMLIGDAPGSDEDRAGTPFVGDSGALLDRMMAHIGLTRETSLYLSNIVFWRPPGNRAPNPAEIATCLPFTKRHIDLVRPEVLVLAGGLAAQSLLDPAIRITRARGKWFDYSLPDGTQIPTLPMLRPSYLLNTPLSKREAWHDLLVLKRRLGQS